MDKRCAVLLSLTIMMSSVYGDTHIPLNSLPMAYDLNYEQIKMPDGEKSMGLLGFNYRLYFTPWFYVGPGAYGAVSGENGGLFTIGGITGVQQHLMGPLSATANMFVGGGGGKASQVGGGAMLQPGVGLLYDLTRDWHVGLNYNYTDFPSGHIHSHQINLSLLLSSDWLYAAPRYAGEKISNLNQVNYRGPGVLNFSHNYLSLLMQSYFPGQTVKDNAGNAQKNVMGTVGFEVGHYFTSQSFMWLKSSGAFHGAPNNGYMDVLAGLGYQYPLGQAAWSLIGQLGAGAAGGGQVNTGGGFIWAPSLGLQYDFTQSFAGRMTAGYLDAPDGKFHATTLTGAVLYKLDFARSSTTRAPIEGDYQFHGWQAEVLNQTYLRPQRASSDVHSSVELLALQLNQLLTPSFYLAYQGAGAYQGSHVGGLATGMLGAGVQTPMRNNTGWQLKGEWLIGAGGGGGLALGGGGITEPNIGVRYYFTPYLGAEASVGRLIAFNNKLNTNVINAGISLNFASLNRSYS